MVLILKRQDVLHDSWLRAARKKKLHYFIPVHHIVTSLSHKDSLWACWYPFPLQGGDNQSPLHTWVSCPGIQYRDSVRALNYTVWSTVQCILEYLAQEYNTVTQSRLWITLFDPEFSALSTIPSDPVQHC